MSCGNKIVSKNCFKINNNNYYDLSFFILFIYLFNGYGTLNNKDLL